MLIDVMLCSFGADVALETLFAVLVRRLLVAEMLLVPFDDFLPLKLPLQNTECRLDRLSFANENLNQWKSRLLLDLGNAF